MSLLATIGNILIIIVTIVLVENFGFLKGLVFGLVLTIGINIIQIATDKEQREYLKTQYKSLLYRVEVAVFGHILNKKGGKSGLQKKQNK